MIYGTNIYLSTLLSTLYYSLTLSLVSTSNIETKATHKLFNNLDLVASFIVKYSLKLAIDKVLMPNRRKHTMDNHYYEEKRNFLRMKIDTRIAYSKLGEDIIHHGTSINLSATGLCMTVTSQLNINDELEIVMSPNGEKLPPFTAKGKVLRCDPDEHAEDLYSVSVLLDMT